MTGFPLTDFLIALLKTPPERLIRADPVRLAEKYGVREDYAAGYLRMHCPATSGEHRG